MTLSKLQSLALGCLMLVVAPAGAGEPPRLAAAAPGGYLPASTDGPEEGGEETESVGDMFLRCCWARGRAAFNFCHAYAACAGVGETICRGIGAAEGLSVSCANPPARLEDLEGG